MGCKKKSIALVYPPQSTTLFVVLIEMKYMDYRNQKAFRMR